MQNLSIPADDHFLPAWLHSCDLPAAPCLVICHGFCGSPTGGSSLELAAALLDKSINTLRFSFTPHRSLSEQVAEIGAVMDYCHSNLHGPFALMGRSMGAAASLIFAAAHPDLAGLCLMACPANLPATFSGMLGPDYERLEAGESVNILYEGQSICLTPDFIQDLKKPDLLRAAASLKTFPLLLVHGLEDSTVAVEQGRSLYEAATCPKKLLLLPGVAHSFFGQADRFVEQVVNFLCRQVFPDRP